MAYSYQDLKKKTVSELREIAKGINNDAVKGYSQLNKEHLLLGLCKALAIDHKVHHVAHGIDKAAIKTRIKTLKKERDDAQASTEKEYEKLDRIRHTIHRLKRTLRKAML